MIDEKSYELFVYYLAIKRHFSSDNYDFFKYNGKIKASKDSFSRRKDRYFFYKITKKYDSKNFILANVLANQKAWIGDIANSENCERIYNDWAKRNESMQYTFKEDLSKLGDDPRKTFKVKDGQLPQILKLYIQDKICIETLLILENLFGIFGYWNKKLGDNPVYVDINTLCGRYYPFFIESKNFNRKKLKSISKEKLSQSS